MGLKAHFSLMDLGFPKRTPTLGIPIDYSEGFDTFYEIFMETATELVPVATGALQNSIDAECNYSEWSATCYASRYYAQYVEYGTYKMRAQPYFEPAIRAACLEAVPIWTEALDEALEEEQEQLEQMAEAAGGGESGGGGFSFLGMILMMIIIALVQFAILAITGQTGPTPSGASDLIYTEITSESEDRVTRSHRRDRANARSKR